MQFNIIAAVDNTGGIGKNNDIPWSNTSIGKQDLKFFRNITYNCIVIMGRKTYESIITLNNQPLKNRINIVLTKQQDYDLKFSDTNSSDYIVNYCNDFNAALQLAESYYRHQHKWSGSTWIIGGADIYKQSIYHRQLDCIILNKIDGDYECDTKFLFIQTNNSMLTYNDDFIFNKVTEITNKDIKDYIPLTADIYKITNKNNDEKQYLQLLEKLLTMPLKDNRTGIPTRSTFVELLRFNLSTYIDKEYVRILPLLTTKVYHVKL